MQFHPLQKGRAHAHPPLPFSRLVVCDAATSVEVMIATTTTTMLFALAAALVLLVLPEFSEGEMRKWRYDRREELHPALEKQMDFKFADFSSWWEFSAHITFLVHSLLNYRGVCGDTLIRK